MERRTLAIILVLTCTLCTSTAALLNKMGADHLELSLKGTIFNYYLLGGLALLGLGFVLLTIALRFGRVTMIYPIIATSYVTVTILAFIFLQEPVGWKKIIAILFIISGVIIINMGDKFD